MANQAIFNSSALAESALPTTDTFNAEGAAAYEFSAKHALAQYAMTGCINATFYASAREQLQMVTYLASEVEPEFLAKVALYSRQYGYMKDMPALCCAALSVQDRALFERVFPRVIDSAKMLRNFVQIMRSGELGRRSLGSLPRKLVRRWLAGRSESQLFADSVGAKPSLADVLKLAHPKPETPEREALYGYFLGKAHNAELLPAEIRDYEQYKSKPQGPLPQVPFHFLTALPLGRKEWQEIARTASWQSTRMNLNTFARHGVFESRPMLNLVANRLRDPLQLACARVFPYQLFAAYRMASDLPWEIREALHDAMELALAQVPALPGQVVVCPDVSGSMSSPISGRRQGATSSVRCIDVAALIASALLRKNRSAGVLPFEEKVVPVRLTARDTVISNAQKLAAIGGGGTSCSAPLAELNAKRARVDLVVLVSDNESWFDTSTTNSTATMQEWLRLKQRCPKARLVCIDLQPNRTTQAKERGDILNIGGFSDHVFELIEKFALGELESGHFVQKIEQLIV